MSSIWDDPDLRTNDSYVKFEKEGDRVSGNVIAIKKHRFDDGSVAPQILLFDDTDGEERTISAGQVRLKAALSEQRPEEGDHITIVYTRQERRAGGKTLKHFEVTVKRGAAGKPKDTPPF